MVVEALHQHYISVKMRFLLENLQNGKHNWIKKNLVFGAKRLLGRKYQDPIVQKYLNVAHYNIKSSKSGEAWLEVGGKLKSPRELYSILLQNVKESVENFTEKPLEDCVMAVPTFANKDQQLALQDAAIKAGINLRMVASDAISAGIAYGLKQRYAVCRVGGSSTSFSIVDYEDGSLNVRAEKIDEFLGGQNFTQTLLEITLNELRKQKGNEVIDEVELIQLEDLIEAAKCELSREYESQIFLPVSRKSFTLKRTHLEHTKHLVNGIVHLAEECLKDSSLNPSDLNQVVMLGGGSRLPIIQEAMKKHFGSIRTEIDPTEVSVLGMTLPIGRFLGKPVYPLINKPKTFLPALINMS